MPKLIAKAYAHHRPRRKSCGECYSAKRSCDQGVPICSRCSKRKLECHYLALPGSQNETTTVELIVPESFQSQVIADEDLLQYSTLEDSADLGLLDNAGDWAVDVDLLNQVAPFNDYLLIHQAGARQGLSSSSFTDARLIPWPNTVTTDLISEATPRLTHAIAALIAAPSQMVLDSQTPWSHPLLYENQMPHSVYVISDAHAACSLYLHKNEKNYRMILRAIDTRADSLIASSKKVTPIENLARVQSLLLYQIIRLYDNDGYLNYKAEAAMPDLELYTYSLLGLIDQYEFTSTQLGTGNGSVLWRSWIFYESARRTLLFSLFFLACYNIFKNGQCQAKTFASSRPWTFSAYLWNAESASEFERSWREKNHFMISNLDFSEVLRDAGPNDVDEFGKIFLVVSQGIYQVREWFRVRGAAL